MVLISMPLCILFGSLKCFFFHGGVIRDCSGVLVCSAFYAVLVAVVYA